MGMEAKYMGKLHYYVLNIGIMLFAASATNLKLSVTHVAGAISTPQEHGIS